MPPTHPQSMMDDTLPAEFWQGFEEFNQREYYACHDTLEAIWMEAAEPNRTFYQGILQIAVALYHLSNANGRGAMILLGEGMQRLRPYQPSYGEVEMEGLLDMAQDLLKTLQGMPTEQLPDLWQQLLQDNPNAAGEAALPYLTRITAESDRAG